MTALDRHAARLAVFAWRHIKDGIVSQQRPRRRRQAHIKAPKGTLAFLKVGAASLYNLWPGSLLQNRPSVTLGAAGDPEVSGRFFETPSSRHEGKESGEVLQVWSAEQADRRRAAPQPHLAPSRLASLNLRPTVSSAGASQTTLSVDSPPGRRRSALKKGGKKERKHFDLYSTTAGEAKIKIPNVINAEDFGGASEETGLICVIITACDQTRTGLNNRSHWGCHWLLL